MESFLRVEVKSLVLDTYLDNDNDCLHYLKPQPRRVCDNKHL